MRIHCDPQLLASIPFADDSDDEEGVYEQELKEETVDHEINAVQKPDVRGPPPVFTFSTSVVTNASEKTMKSETSDSVFSSEASTPPISSTALAMFEAMSGKRRRSSDPYPRPVEELTPLSKISSLPMPEEKIYPCWRSYREAERQEVPVLLLVIVSAEEVSIGDIGLVYVQVVRSQSDTDGLALVDEVRGR